MKLAFLNPQGNFDAHDSYWTEHPDFGGQLVYVKEVALALAALGHQVDIITRQVVDPNWPEFASPLDAYPGVEGVRIVRLPCGPEGFLQKEHLWPYLGKDWVPNILAFYQNEGSLPETFNAHYADGGLVAALLSRQTNRPFTFTAHSLGAQKMDKLEVNKGNIATINYQYHFSERILAERVSMNHASRVITSTRQELGEQYGHRVYQGAINPADAARFAVIPPGVNQQIFSPVSSDLDDQIAHRIELALARDLPPERRKLPLVLASSRLVRKKNLIGLVKAFALSPELQAVANLAIAVRNLNDPLRQYHSLSHSEAAIMDGVMAVVNAFGLRGCLTAFAINHQIELAATYRVIAQRRSVFALTSLYEPFGLTPLEAMSCGLPVVATQHGGPSESLREGEREFGVLVDPAKPDDIARGLLQLLESTQRWGHFQQVGLERVLEKYTWERTAQGYLQVIDQLQVEQPGSGQLGIPAWFSDPNLENEIPLNMLCQLYFHESC